MKDTRSQSSSLSKIYLLRILAAWVALMSLHCGLAQAAMVSTESHLTSQFQAHEPQTLEPLMASAQVQEILVDMGVDPADVENRIAHLTPQELAAMNQDIEDMPAGSGIAGLVVLVFVVLIALDLLGTTNIFPAIDPIN